MSPIRNKQNSTFLDRSSLVGEWLLDGDAKDTSGNGNNGTATNITWVDAERGYVSEIASASAGNINMGNTTITGDFYFDCLISLSADTGGQQWVISHESGTTAAVYSFALRWIRTSATQGYWNFDVRDSVGAFYTVGNTTPVNLSAQQNVRLQAVHDKTNSKIKLKINDGDFVETTTAGNELSNNTTNLRFMQRAGGSGSNVNGKLGLVRQYSGVGTEYQRTALHLEGLRKFGPFNAQGGKTANAIDFNGSNEYLANTTATTLGVANAFSVSCWVDFTTTGTFAIPAFMSPTTASRASAIYWYKDNAEKFTIRLYNSAGTEFKRYISSGAIGGKTNIGFTWNGTNLKMYVNGVDVTSSATKSIDSAGTMSDSSRQIYIGSDTGSYMTGKIAKIDMWNSDLSGTEMTALYDEGNGVHIDSRNSKGNYTSNANLKHQWLLGKDSSDIGADYVASGGIDIDVNAVNVTADDIVVYDYQFPRYSLPNLNEGKVLHIDGTNNGTTYYDQSGNGNHGTQSGGVTTSQLGLNKKIIFGASDVITISDSTSLDTGNTISVFYNAMTTTSNNGYTISKWDLTNGFLTSVGGVSTGTNTFDVRIGTSAFLNGISNVADGNWHRVGFTYDGTTLKTYIDGILEQSVLRTGTINNNVSLYLSTRNGSAGPWLGSLIEPEIYNRVLTPEEIQQDFTSNFIPN